MSAGSLARTQQRLRRLITWPEGVREALAEEPPGQPPLSQVVKSDARLCAEDRLDVYANAYFYRIHDVLAEDFPALARLLGEDAFHDLVTSYLAVCPSRQPSLRHVGARLADFLDTHAAAESFRKRFPWAGDLARYEAASEDVFDAKETPAATREDLAAVAPEDWAELSVRLRPSVVVLRVDWRVDEARRAVRESDPEGEAAGPGAAPVTPPRPAPAMLCLWRRDEQVVTRALAPDEARALEAVAAGATFGVLCEHIAADCGEDEAPARAAGWLAGWVDAGWVRRPGA